jgi:hypothetical protein
MDDMNSAFGSLSTKASEWKPTTLHSVGSSGSAGSDPQSDLKATAVKEFVPGRAWTAAAEHGEIKFIVGRKYSRKRMMRSKD